MAGDFSGGVQLKRGDGATPTEVFTLVPGVLVQVLSVVGSGLVVS